MLLIVVEQSRCFVFSRLAMSGLFGKIMCCQLISEVLSFFQGVKQVTLLGQNVNSYRDLSESSFPCTSAADPGIVPGFRTKYKTKKGGHTFLTLLDKASLIDPEMRIRFTSPHPKDFPFEVAFAEIYTIFLHPLIFRKLKCRFYLKKKPTLKLVLVKIFKVLQLIKERPNICKQIHLPAQSGNNTVLEAMDRGYTREIYLDLVSRIKTIMPGNIFHFNEAVHKYL